MILLPCGEMLGAYYRAHRQGFDGPLFEPACEEARRIVDQMGSVFNAPHLSRAPETRESEKPLIPDRLSYAADKPLLGFISL